MRVFTVNKFPQVVTVRRRQYNTGPDLRGGGRGPGPQAPHQQGAPHQTLHILLLVQSTLI